MKLNKFQRVVNRMMTGDEARERAYDMGLSEELVEFLGDDFDSMNDFDDDHGDYDRDEEEGVGENGRAALGQSHEYKFEELAEVMGIDQNDPAAWDAALEPTSEVSKVYNAFYEE